MLWVLVWVVLVLAGAAVLGWLGLRDFHKAVALMTELGRAADLVGQVGDQARRAARDRQAAADDDAARRVTPQDATPLTPYAPRMGAPASERL